MVTIPAFGETEYFDNRQTPSSRVILICNAAPNSFDRYCSLLEGEGYARHEAELSAHRCFAAYRKDGQGIFINYFENTDQLQLVVEEESPYFSYSDSCGPVCTTPRITQVYLSDYGLSDVIRLSDGRLIIIDGANLYEKDIDNLFARLKKDSPFEKPVVAAWIMTHPHSDHYFCFFPFMEKYGQEVTVQRFFFNFPDAYDTEHYPKLAAEKVNFQKWSGREDFTCSDILDLFRKEVAALGIPVYVPHTGQRYSIGDAKLLFFASLDDTIHCSQNINATSLMFSMELGGQTLLLTGDGSFSDAMMAERYGKELKCDILQVPHHGFGCGTEEGQIAGFRLAAPQVCLLPVEKKLAYTSFTTYREGTNYLFTRQNVQEMITGEKERTLELPYTPDPAGVYELQKRYLQGRDDAGARTWVFTDLNTGNKEDFVFSVLNMNYINANISVELFFENMQKKILRIKNQGPRLGVFRVNCLLRPDEDQAQFDQPDFFEQLGIPENTFFSVRFISSVPVVISHRSHTAAYRSSIV